MAFFRGLRPAGRNRGVTIFELVIVIVIIGILCAIAAPLTSRTLARSRLNGAVATIRSAVVLARSLAMANTQVHYGVYLNSTKNGVLIFYDDNGDNQYASADDRTYEPLQSLPQNVTFAGNTFAPAWNVVFRGDGSAKSGGTMTISSGGRTKTITIAQTSGEVTVQ